MRPARADRAERRIVAGLRRGDHAATRAIYERLAPTVLGFLTRIVGDRATAEDVLQDVFVDVWRRGATFDPARGGLTGWVFAIARNRAIDHLRRRTPEPRDPSSGALDAVSESEVDALLGEWRLASLLARLPQEEGALLSMRFRDGLSQSEIAGRMGIPLGTVKLRMVRGLDRLRGLVEREEERP